MSKSNGIRPDLFFLPLTVVKGLVGNILSNVDEISDKFHSKEATSIQLNLCNTRLKRIKTNLNSIAFDLLTIEHVIDMSKTKEEIAG